MNNLVVNEWFLHDLFEDNGRYKLGTASKLLWNLMNKDEFVLCVGRNTPWTQKLLTFAEDHKQPSYSLFKLLISLLRDSEKCNLVDGVVSEKPEDVDKECAPKEDYYLIDLSINVSPCTLVSTDVELLDCVKNNSTNWNINPMDRDGFLLRCVS